MVDGTPFGKYLLVEELGRGSMGVVYKAWDPALSRHVAIKFLVEGAPGDHVERFLREARSTAALKHPNLARVFESGERDGRYYMVMQYIPGGDLGKKTLDPRRAAEVVRDVARGVHCAHEARIIHRDIKPSNIMVDENGTPYVTDFGLAKLQNAGHGITRMGSTVGSPAYMSPEQACGQSARIGPRSDVYSLGATLYTLLTGKRPFDESTAYETMLAVRDKPVVPPGQLVPGLSPVLERICLKAMSKRPDDRQASAAALADELERFVAAPEVRAVARDTTGSSRRRRPAPRRGRRALVAVGIALPSALLLALAVWRFVPRGAPPAAPVAPPPPEVQTAEAWVVLASGSVVRIEWTGRPAPGKQAAVRWRGVDLAFAAEDVREVLSAAPPAPARPRGPQATSRLGPRDFGATDPRIDFDRDPAGHAIPAGSDVEMSYRTLGVVFDSGVRSTFVHADAWAVKSWSGGRSGAVHDPRWEGSVSISLYVPGTVDPSKRLGVPAGVHRLGVFVSDVVPGGTALVTYGVDGSRLVEILTESEGTDFLAVESPVAIHRAEVVPLPRIDRNVTTDDWVFDEIVGPDGDPRRFTVLLEGDERVVVRAIRGDAERLWLGLVDGGDPAIVPVGAVLEVLPPTERLVGASPLRELGPDVRVVRWDVRGVDLATGETVPWETIRRVRR